MCWARAKLQIDDQISKAGAGGINSLGLNQSIHCNFSEVTQFLCGASAAAASSKSNKNLFVYRNHWRQHSWTHSSSFNWILFWVTANPRRNRDALEEVPSRSQTFTTVRCKVAKCNPGKNWVYNLEIGLRTWWGSKFQNLEACCLFLPTVVGRDFSAE